MDTTKIENHYHISVNDFIEKIIADERQKIFQALKDSGVLVEHEDEVFGVAYTNWENRTEEGHVPQIALKKVI